MSMGLRMIDPDNPISALNSKLHQNKIYNAFQTGVTALAVFTGAASATMACFVAGILVLTSAGMVAIEKLKSQDVVISADVLSYEVQSKNITDIYKRHVNKLIYITVGKEVIETTENHPFYVKNRGFVEASNLLAEDILLDVYGNPVFISNIETMDLDEPKDVFNLSIEDFHTYFVGKSCLWVHNKNCPPYMNEDGTLKPNQEYKTGEHDYVYKTDENGNICSVHADELKLKTHDGRLKHNPNTPNKLAGDDAGHLIADRFGGSPDLDNLVSQDSILNRAVRKTENYNSMEKSWSKALNKGKKVTDVDIKLEYGESNRPSSFQVSYKIDGEFFSHIFNQ